MTRRDELRALAEEAAESLFTNGERKHGVQLRMVNRDGVYLGGWGKRAVADKLFDLLLEADRRRELST